MPLEKYLSDENQVDEVFSLYGKFPTTELKEKLTFLLKSILKPVEKVVVWSSSRKKLKNNSLKIDLDFIEIWQKLEKWFENDE